MAFAENSSSSIVSVQTLAFPEGVDTTTKWCRKGAVYSTPSPVTSAKMGNPAVLTIQKPRSKSSTITVSKRTTSLLRSAKITPNTGTSRNLIDSEHRKSLNGKNPQLVPPCAESVVLGAGKAFIGKCVPKHMAPSKQRFSLTEDPRKRFCLRNPYMIHFKPIPPHQEQQKIRELVKTADNLVSSSESHSVASSICEVVDLTNPLNLDFQGMDHKKTYGEDEQACQNQMEYRRVRRFKHRRNLKLQTVIDTEREQHSMRIAIPKHFSIRTGRSLARRIRLSDLREEENTFGKLVRAEQKPGVKKRLEEEEKNRRERYKQLYLKKQKKMAQKQEERQAEEKAAAENMANNLAEKDINDLLVLLDRTIHTKKLAPREIQKRRDFPHTISEALKFRHQLKKSKRILRDQAKVKQEFYEQQGRQKKIPAAELEISSDSPTPSPRNENQSTNDEDDMTVGQKGSKFLLRGFQYRLGSNLRGKFHQKGLADGERTVKGCITREEWFETLVSKTKRGDSPSKRNQVQLFPQEFGLPQINVNSPVKEFRKKPLGRHYERVIRKNLRIKKPKQTKVRKFNLIGYLYGITGKKKEKVASLKDLRQSNIRGETTEYLLNKAKIEADKRRMLKRRRMRYLGIPYFEKPRKYTKSVCENSESGDSDWIPYEPEEQQTEIERINLRYRGNMPAPEFRETTLRRHPRYPRDYKSLRIPSEVFMEYVQSHHIPILQKLKEEKIVPENVREEKKTIYGRKFEGRHHHDHWNPTQHQWVHIRYRAKIVRPKLLESPPKRGGPKDKKTFDKARPRPPNVEDINFPMPKLNLDEIVKGLDKSVKPKARQKEQLLPVVEDKVFHSLPDGELQEFPGRERFLEFLSEIKAEFNKRIGLVDPELNIDKTDFIEELKEDLQSIESCLSSLSSSECTNLTNDSGSFLMAGDQKIPLDYIRKSLVPFEEMNRSNFEAIPIDPAKGENDPYEMVPFAGQQKEQLSMAAAKDGFFTFNTRLQNGLRLRLETKQEDRKKKLLGVRGGIKAPAKVATDIDELYIEDLRNRPNFKPFKWNSCRTMIKEALRKKFESMLIQGEIVRSKIYDRRNDNYFNEMMKMKVLLDKLFAKWEKKEYESAMEVVQKVKPYYEATDKYRQEALELGKQYTVLNMEIVYIENDWMRRTILQNFHYLLAEMEWRVENDWIHRNADGELEGYEESIAKRYTTNIRKRDKDDAWAIKEYYDNVYLPNYHPVVVVFRDADEFINGIENLKSKTFILLLELHYTLWILAELNQKYQEFSDWCTEELNSKKTYAENKCASKYFMEDRANQLKTQVHTFLGKPIDKTFGDIRLNTLKGICNEVYRDIVPASSQIEASVMDQVASISQILSDLLGKFEGINPDHRRKVEKKYRRLLAYRQNQSKQAVLVEKRIASEMVKVLHNLEPPFQKPKREGKLPRSELKEPVRVVHQKPVRISEKTKFFYKAFHEEGDLQGLKEARESLDVINDIQESIVPFYFDHFLSINGYQPNYNFKTRVELRDGPEIDRLRIKSVLPEVVEKFEKWKTIKKRTMEENIRKNPQMYENVRT